MGLMVDSETMKLRLPEEKVQLISTKCSQTLAKDVITAQWLASVIGRLSAARPAVLPAPLHLWHLQYQLIQTLKASGSFKSPVTLNQDSRDELMWWIHQLHLWNGRDITSPPSDLIIQSDASLKGWGAVCNGQRTRGHWSVQEKKLHINSLELLAGTFAIKAFVKHQSNIQVLLRMDNRSAVAYVNRMGGHAH